MTCSAPSIVRAALTPAVLLLVVLSWVPASADITRLGQATQVGSGLGEIHPDIAFDDKNGAYLAVWGDGGGGTYRPAYARLLSLDGTAGGALLLDSCAGELYGQRPRVAYSAGSTDDVFLVTYREWCSGSVTFYVHLVKYSVNGPVSVGRVGISTAGNAKAGGIVYNPVKKQFVVVWEETSAATASWDPMYAVVALSRDVNGVVTGFAGTPAKQSLTPFLPEAQGLPEIALDVPGQNYMIVFQGEDPNSSQNGMFAKALDATTGALSPLVYVSLGGYAVEASVEFLPSAGEFLAVWRQDSDVVGRRLQPLSGTPTSNIYPVLATPGSDGATSIAYDVGSHNGMVVGMNDDQYAWASELSSTGLVLGSFRASSVVPASTGTFFPRVTATGWAQFGMVYGVDYARVYLDRFSASGGPPPPPPPPADPPLVTSATSPLYIGASNNVNGLNFTAGSVIKLYVATATGSIPYGPFTPTTWSSITLTWDVPPNIPLGNGFAGLQVINTDQNFAESNVVEVLLAGDPADNIPFIQAINGMPLAPAEPGLPTAHIDVVLPKGSVVTITGSGFNNPLVNLYTAHGNVGPLTPLAGWTANSLQVVVPGIAPTGPGTFQVVNEPYATGNVASNAVATVIQARVTITGVSMVGSTVTVTGTGFSARSVVNLFNGGQNLGGLGPGGGPRIPLTIPNEFQLSFQRPAGAVAGAAFVQVLNPPFGSFHSSGDDSDGGFPFP